MSKGNGHGLARRLRQGMTDAERLFWYRLRNRALDGWKFRRQHPVGPYVLDFACVEAMLAIELDGGQHIDSKRDMGRDAYLRGRGWRVLRFWNDDALRRTDEVVSAIQDALTTGAGRVEA